MSLVKFSLIFIGIVLGIQLSLTFASPWNNPNAMTREKNVGYIAFESPPKTFDPARSYTVEESQIIAQIYEAPLQYHYLLRPYTLVPLVAQNMPIETYYNAKNQEITNSPRISRILSIRFIPSPFNLAFFINRIPRLLKIRMVIIDISICANSSWRTFINFLISKRRAHANCLRMIL